MNAGRVTVILGGLAIALGCAHMAFLLAGPLGWTERRLWFAGSGLAILATALLNLVGRHVPGRSLSGAAIISADLLLAAFFLSAWPLLQGPQTLIGAALFLTLAALTALRKSLRLPD